ncbi:MAG TPA: hypothetical protein VK892_15170 [Pyrinomonadaceae bacterium]|nr:hypothetical protein [Pyrinomonadaceae bacterium]
MHFRIFTICSLILIFPSLIFAQTVSNENQPAQNSSARIRTFSPFRKKPSGEQKKQLQASAEDLAKHAQFLEQPKTGIFRLLPESGCNENKYVINASPDCLNYIPDSSYYSFREKEHTAEILSDIRLEKGYLISDGILTQGILVELGDISLKDVSLESDGLDFLRNYVPETLSKDAYKQFLQITKGIGINNFFYRKALPANENSTYALRVIAYKASIFQTFRRFRYNILEGDKRIDLTLAFRVIRKDADGSVTLLWKELERREAPRINFPKKKK